MSPSIPDLSSGAAVTAAPELTIDGPGAVITSVLFRLHIRCAWCQATNHLISHGTVMAGLSISASRKTCRWYQLDKPGPLPPLPGECPECGKPRPYSGYPAREAAAISDCKTTLPLLDRVWAALRADYPAEAARADEADRRQLRRPARTGS
jgi:hypothetical protein